MKVLALLIFLIAPAFSHAQGWGLGMSPAMSCPNPYGPARNAISGGDEITNLRGKLANTEKQILDAKAASKRMDKFLEKDKEKMGEVLTDAAIRSIEDHYRLKNNYDSYQTGCGGAPPPSHVDDVILPGQRRTVNKSNDDNRYPPPQEFCFNDGKKVVNTWASLVEDEGTVSSEVCDDYIPRVEKSKDRRDRDDCHNGLEDYYKQMALKVKRERHLSELEDDERYYENRLSIIDEQVTEGTYCPWCEAHKSGYANGTSGNVMQNLAALMSMAGGRGGARPGFGGGYPASPYAAQIPGYYGMGPGGMYGAVPGGIGPGAFACQGSNPMAMGNPLTSPGMMPIIGGQMSPFMNPFMSPQNMGMFNPGAGPGWGFPQYGNGINGTMNPFLQNPYMANNMLNPYGMNPYGMNPYGMNPYGMANPYGMNPYAMNNPYGMNPYGMMGPYGGMNPNGMGPYGYGAGPYGNGSMFNGGFGNMYGGVPNYGYGYGYPYGGGANNSVGSFYSQIDQLKNTIQNIQNSTYYGGGYYPGGSYYGGGLPPTALPYNSYQYQPSYYNPSGATPPAYAPYLH